MFLLLLIFVFLIAFLLKTSSPYDKRGFNRKGYHKNGTKYDDYGYDVKGYDINGYDRQGFDCDGYNQKGFNKAGYNIDGKNVNGKYNRFYDVRNYEEGEYNKDGFLDPTIFPVSVSEHAMERICERLADRKNVDAVKLAKEAYAYGKSARQLMKTSAQAVREIETRHTDSTALIYNGYIYIFSDENKLITMYKNDKIII